MKMVKRFEGQIHHTEESIRRLFRTKRNIYDTRRSALRMIIGAALVIIGLVTNISLAMQGMMIMIGSWLLVSRDFPAKIAAEEALEMRRKRKKLLPTITTTFYDFDVKLSGEGKMKFKYNQFSHLTEDEAYFYLFLEKDSVCMIDKQSLQPNTLEEFKAYMTKKTGLGWTEMKSWLHMNIFEIINRLKSSSTSF